VPPNDQNYFVSGKKYSYDCDRGGLVSPCYEYNVAGLFVTPRSHNRIGIENTTTEGCHDICKGIPGCLMFTWFHKYPRDQKVVDGVCFLFGNKDRKICHPGAVTGWVESHDCGPQEGSSFPPPPLPPMTHDWQHLSPADPSLYYGLPTDPDSRALGKKGSRGERSYHRGDLGAPPYLTKELRYQVRFNELARKQNENCGCYHLGVQPDPSTAVVLSNMQLLYFPPEQCQSLCQADRECDAFSSMRFQCLLWKNVTRWSLDQVEPISISGPKWCPGALLEQGYVCGVEHYRQRFTSLALLLLRVPDVTMPYGQPCSFEIDSRPLVAVLIVVMVVLLSVGLAYHSKKRHSGTVIWRVVAAVLAGLASIVHIVFVASLFRFGSGAGLVFWVGCAHFLFLILFNEASVVIVNLAWVTRHTTYRTLFQHRHKPAKVTTLADIRVDDKATTTMATPTPLPTPPPSRSTSAVKKGFTTEASFQHQQHDDEHQHHAHEPKDQTDDVCLSGAIAAPSFQMHMHMNAPPEADSSRCVFPSILQALKAHPSAPIAAESSPDSPPPLLPLPVPQSLPAASHAATLEQRAEKPPKPTLSDIHEDSQRTTLAPETGRSTFCPFTTSAFEPATSATPTATEEKSVERESSVASKAAEGDGKRGVRWGRALTQDEWEGEEEARAFGPMFVSVLFGSFLSVGVLHVCWSSLFSLPFFSIPVSATAFETFELLSLVGDGPFLAIQLLTVFLSSRDGYFADSVPPVALAAILLSAGNIGGVVVRFAWSRIRRATKHK